MDCRENQAKTKKDIPMDKPDGDQRQDGRFQKERMIHYL